jgi:acetyl-CoA carboxylase biotin carboxyl carrier protein
VTEPGPDVERPEAAIEAICRNALLLLDTARDTPARLRIEAVGCSVELEWPTRSAPPPTAAPAITALTTTAVPPAPAVAHPEQAAPARATAPADGGPVRPVQENGAAGRFCILAPSVGTFYHAPEPGAAPFVRVGDELEPGRQVGILEVMKLLTPITAEQRGRVVELLVPDASPVEHGQPLIACAAPQ